MSSLVRRRGGSGGGCAGGAAAAGGGASRASSGMLAASGTVTLAAMGALIMGWLLLLLLLFVFSFFSLGGLGSLIFFSFFSFFSFFFSFFGSGGGGGESAWRAASTSKDFLRPPSTERFSVLRSPMAAGVAAARRARQGGRRGACAPSSLPPKNSALDLLMVEAENLFEMQRCWGKGEKTEE